MQTAPLTRTFDSSLAAVEDSAQAVVAWLVCAGAGDHAADLELAVREAVANAVVHGHASLIEVAARHTPDGVELTVRDGGRGFDVAAVGDPTAAGNLHKPSGRGMFLIRHLVDRAAWSTGPDGTTVVMTRAFVDTRKESADGTQDYTAHQR